MSAMRFCVVVYLVAAVSAFYSPSDSVVDLHEKDFDAKVVNGEGAWIVEFYAPWCGHCKNFIPEFAKAAKVLKGIAGVGAVDATQEKALASRFGVKGYPSVKLFVGDKTKPIDYRGQRTAEALVKTLSDEVQSAVKSRLGAGSSGGKKDAKKDKKDAKSKKEGTAVIELTDDNFEKLVLKSDDLWLVEFFAPWCGHCKNLAPHWEKAAKKLEGRIKLGALDATSQTRMAQKYGIKGFPTIKFFGPGGVLEDYEGGRTANDIVEYGNDKAEENATPPTMEELTSSGVADETCREGKTLCVLAFLPSLHDCDAKCRLSHVETFNDLAKTFRKQPWGWLWTEGGAQPSLESALEVGGFGYPALVAVNAKKLRASSFTGSFSKDGIHEFLRDLAFGKGRTVPLKEWPKIEKTKPWDGKDAKSIEADKDEL